MLLDTLLNSSPIYDILRETINSNEFQLHMLPPTLFSTRVVSLVKAPEAARTRENTRLFAISPLITRIVEAIVRIRLLTLVED